MAKMHGLDLLKLFIGHYTSIHLDMFVPRESEPVNVKGILKWREERGNAFIGGIELTKILDKIEWTKLTFFLS
jgi:hypothetical protein